MTRAKTPIPEGYHSVTPSLTFKNVAKAIEFYRGAFGAKENYRLMDPDGESVIHAELQIGDSIIMMGTEMDGMGLSSAETLQGSPVAFCIYVENVDDDFKTAIDAGAREEEHIAEQFWGDRMGTVSDPFGYRWSLATRVEDLTTEEIRERAKSFFAKMAA